MNTLQDKLSSIHTSSATLATSFDYIIAGAGCAGLSLVWRMLDAGFQQEILLIDRELKQNNDRTWSFWEKGVSKFEEIIYKKWNKIDFHGEHFSRRLDIFPYEYKTIRGIDFYNFVLPKILAAPNVHFLKADINNIKVENNQGVILTSVGKFTADYIFNSSIREKIPTSYNYVIQHFKGWIIETPTDSFEPDIATFMDFRIDQKGETRFVYVLPKNKRQAMIEGTIFSTQLLTNEEYDQINSDYIRDFLNIEDYKIIEEETGSIPMTDFPFKRGIDERVINLGTSGGLVKPSSGYAFIRIQEHTQAIVEAIQQKKSPLLQPSWYQQRFRFYDAILLNVMLNHRLSSHIVFTELFKHNSAPAVFKFLNEKTPRFSELKLMITLPWMPFIYGLIDEVKKVWRR